MSAAPWPPSRLVRAWSEPDATRRVDTLERAAASTIRFRDRRSLVGVRFALGATPGDVSRLVVEEALRARDRERSPASRSRPCRCVGALIVML